jgi:hypothetical protein
VEIFNLWKLNKIEVKKQHHIEISDRLAALENISDSEDKNRDLEDIKCNIKSQLKRA